MPLLSLSKRTTGQRGHTELRGCGGHRAVKLLDELESPVEEFVLPAFDPVVTMAAIAEHQVADVLLVPTMIEMIVDHPEVGAYDLSCLQNLTYGASPICEALLLRGARCSAPRRSLRPTA